MADDIRVTNPVSIDSDSKSRVAYDLMELIAAHEGNDVRKTRDYWLTLYTQCYKATNGRMPKYVLNINE